MPDRVWARGSVSAPERLFIAMALAAMTAILVGCGSATASISPSTGSPAPTTEPRSTEIVRSNPSQRYEPGSAEQDAVPGPRLSSGGVLVVGIHTRNGGFDAGVALGDPVVATLTVEP